MSTATLDNSRSARRGGRLWLARLLLALLAILLPIVLLEVGFRVAGPFIPGNYDTGSYLTRHPRYGHYHPASYSGWIKRDEYTVQVQTNAERQRGRAIPVEKAPGTFRILVLGDSFVEAVQVADRERFLTKLQDLLNAGGGPTRYELIDGGCGGWGQVQELLYLQQEGPRYKPDLVLLAFFVGNDVNNNSYELELEGNHNAALKPYVEREADGALTLLEPNPPALTFWERVGFFLRERSALYNVVESGVLQKLSLDDLWSELRDLDARGVELAIREAEVYSTRPDDRWKDAWSLTDTLIGQIGQEAGAQGAKLGVMLVPTKAQVLPDAWRALTGSNEGRDRAFDPLQPNKHLAGIAQRASAPFLDLTPQFRETGRARGAPQLYFPRDQHWTAAGHDLAARTMADWLKTSGLLPG